MPNAVPHPTDLVPARRLPILYLSFAHASLLAVATLAAIDPAAIAGFYYHPRMIGLVHLVTLGWITGSIVGMFYIVAPLALRTPMPARRLDYWAFAFFGIGVAGMVTHFWIEQFSGMAWSAGMVLAAVIQFATRVFSQLRTGTAPTAVARPIRFALANLVAAAALGVLLGVDREADVMPGATLGNVYGHAHLAAVGWAVMMVVAVGHRLLPMVLPSAVPTGMAVQASTWLIELGVLGLATTLLLARDATVFAAVVGAGLGLFLGQVVWMVRHRRQPPAALPRPDWGTGQAVQALVYLGAATGLGLWIAATPAGPSSAWLAMVYGVIGLVGFLAQLVAGIEARILPLFQWHTSFAASGRTRRPPSPHGQESSVRRAAIVCSWTGAVPCLAVGLTIAQADWVRAGAALLLAAALLQTFGLIRTLRTRAS